ncbi:16S rRNA (adenine(1518)-N(6)/adenine(1519)-N(6))-dimethyltransferase RsmA [Marisediminicola antarctica]|uniref:Ribosomal RNA small subunit methyltransferase A n=1 Tax=Marisediminicola antarctica TaxID=674079 RepID=A0A7L5AHQ4_9MICO|nr:16S rRNA (adenine(1518)-N(6)/adenine(1519)-N(6))-dimethyltransferase RsmA [Marisediminicola antarctica]QHO69285.1 16S rRNA (adenine(1518)-N(6)/adenine(1519)-N(6))-dimethyltransferase [Marisediminicola antarctica]
MALLGPAEIRDLAELLGIQPTKKLGQNFVIDANTVRRIVKAAGVTATDTVVEIGPGLGSLTLGLLETGASVIAVEIDKRLAAQLPLTVEQHLPRSQAPSALGSHDRSHDRPGSTALAVVTHDAMRVTELPGDPGILVANLPYNISVPVLLHFLETFRGIRSGLVMVQAEVGQRLAAPPGSKIYGSPSVKAAWFGHWKTSGSVSRQVFWPVPNVDSILVSFALRETPIGTEEERLATFAIVDAAFQQRRKMLRQALADLFGSSAAASATMERAGIDPTTRGEQLTGDDFLAIARAKG